MREQELLSHVTELHYEISKELIYNDCRYGNLCAMHTIIALCDMRKFVNFRDEDGNTPLHYVYSTVYKSTLLDSKVKIEHKIDTLHMINCFITLGIDPDVRNVAGLTAAALNPGLHEAYVNDYPTRQISELLDLCSSGSSLIYIYYDHKPSEFFQSIRDEHGNTLLHLASKNHYNNLYTIDYLVQEKKLSLLTPNNAGETSVDVASKENIQHIHRMIQSGLDTILHDIQNGCYDVAQDILTASVSRWKIFYGENYWDKLLKHTKNKLFEILWDVCKAGEENSLKYMMELLPKEQVISLQNKYERTLLHAAVTYKGDKFKLNGGIIKYLVDNGLNIDAQDKKGMMPTLFAIAYHKTNGQNLELGLLYCRSLISAFHANVNIKDKEGHSLLQIGCQLNSLTIVKHLMFWSCDPTLLTHGKTAWAYIEKSTVSNGVAAWELISYFLDVVMSSQKWIDSGRDIELEKHYWFSYACKHDSSYLLDMLCKHELLNLKSLFDNDNIESHENASLRAHDQSMRNVPPSYYESVIQAAMNDKIQIIQYIIEELKLDPLWDNGIILEFAIDYDNVRVFDYLITKCGAEVLYKQFICGRLVDRMLSNINVREKQEVLDYCVNKFYVDCHKELYDNPMIFASGNYRIAQYLLSHDKHLCDKYADGTDLFFFACKYDNALIAEFLLKKGFIVTQEYYDKLSNMLVQYSCKHESILRYAQENMSIINDCTGVDCPKDPHSNEEYTYFLIGYDEVGVYANAIDH